MLHVSNSCGREFESFVCQRFFGLKGVWNGGRFEVTFTYGTSPLMPLSLVEWGTLFTGSWESLNSTTWKIDYVCGESWYSWYKPIQCSLCIPSTLSTCFALYWSFTASFFSQKCVEEIIKMALSGRGLCQHKKWFHTWLFNQQK